MLTMHLRRVFNITHPQRSRENFNLGRVNIEDVFEDVSYTPLGLGRLAIALKTYSEVFGRGRASFARRWNFQRFHVPSLTTR